jgi:hypothetical protein
VNLEHVSLHCSKTLFVEDHPSNIPSTFASKSFCGKLMDDDDADDPNKADDNTHKGDNISHDHLG